MLIFDKIHQLIYLFKNCDKINEYFKYEVINHIKIIFLFIEIFIIFLIVMILLIPSFIANCYLRFKKIDTRKNIILIHGTNVSSIQWYIFRLYLVIFLNEYNIISLDYNSTQKIKLSIGCIIEQINDVNNNSDTILIGHSQGALISEVIYKLHRGNINKNIIKVVSLNCVIKGSHLLTYIVKNRPKYFTFDEVDYDMCIDAPLFEKLNNIPNDNIYRIIAKHDLFLINDNCKNKNTYYTNMGHYYAAVDLLCFIEFIKRNILH